MVNTIQNARIGQRKALGKLYENNKNEAYYLALCLLGDEGLSAEAVSTVFKNLRNDVNLAYVKDEEEFKTIRQRAGLAPMTEAELTLDNLLLERQHELAMEGWSRQDLIRFGHYLDKWWAKPQGSEYMLLLPIPELARGSNPKLNQNPGY